MEFKSEFKQLCLIFGWKTTGGYRYSPSAFKYEKNLLFLVPLFFTVILAVLHRVQNIDQKKKAVTTTEMTLKVKARFDRNPRRSVKKKLLVNGKYRENGCNTY